jgi:hypothetical protein
MLPPGLDDPGGLGEPALDLLVHLERDLALSQQRLEALPDRYI